MLPLFDAVDYGVSHNYGKRAGASWTEMDAWTLRFRHAFDAIRAAGHRVPPWLITEGGLDIAGDKNTSGWRGPGGPSEAQYADQCVLAAQRVAQFPEVQCYAIFTALPTDWVGRHHRVYGGDWRRDCQRLSNPATGGPLGGMTGRDTQTEPSTTPTPDCKDHGRWGKVKASVRGRQPTGPDAAPRAPVVVDRNGRREAVYWAGNTCGDHAAHHRHQQAVDADLVELRQQPQLTSRWTRGRGDGDAGERGAACGPSVVSAALTKDQARYARSAMIVV